MAGRVDPHVVALEGDGEKVELNSLVRSNPSDRMNSPLIVFFIRCVKRRSKESAYHGLFLLGGRALETVLGIALSVLLVWLMWGSSPDTRSPDAKDRRPRPN